MDETERLKRAVKRAARAIVADTIICPLGRSPTPDRSPYDPTMECELRDEERCETCVCLWLMSEWPEEGS